MGTLCMWLQLSLGTTWRKITNYAWECNVELNFPKLKENIRAQTANII